MNFFIQLLSGYACYIFAGNHQIPSWTYYILDPQGNQIATGVTTDYSRISGILNNEVNIDRGNF